MKRAARSQNASARVCGAERDMIRDRICKPSNQPEPYRRFFSSSLLSRLPSDSLSNQIKSTRNNECNNTTQTCTAHLSLLFFYLTSKQSKLTVSTPNSTQPPAAIDGSALPASNHVLCRLDVPMPQSMLGVAS